jgi:hypothetical protein
MRGVEETFLKNRTTGHSTRGLFDEKRRGKPGAFFCLFIAIRRRCLGIDKGRGSGQRAGP